MAHIAMKSAMKPLPVLNNGAFQETKSAHQPVKREVGTCMTLGDRPGLPSCVRKSSGTEYMIDFDCQTDTIDVLFQLSASPPIMHHQNAQPVARRRRRPARLRTRSQMNQPPKPHTSDESYGRLAKKDSLEIYRRMMAEKAANRQLAMSTSSTEDVRGQAPCDAKYPESSSFEHHREYMMKRGNISSFEQMTAGEDHLIQSSSSNNNRRIPAAATELNSQLHSRLMPSNHMGQGDRCDTNSRPLAIHPSVAALLPPHIQAALINDQNRHSAVQKKLQELTELVTTPGPNGEEFNPNDLWQDMANLKLQETPAPVWSQRELSGMEPPMLANAKSMNTLDPATRNHSRNLKPNGVGSSPMIKTGMSQPTKHEGSQSMNQTSSLMNSGMCHGHQSMITDQDMIMENMRQSHVTENINAQLRPGKPAGGCYCERNQALAQMGPAISGTACMGACGDPSGLPVNTSQSCCQIRINSRDCLEKLNIKQSTMAPHGLITGHCGDGLIVVDNNHYHRVLRQQSPKTLNSAECEPHKKTFRCPSGSSPEYHVAQKMALPKKIRTSADSWQLTLTCTGQKNKPLQMQKHEASLPSCQSSCRLAWCTQQGICSPAGVSRKSMSMTCMAPCCSRIRNQGGLTPCLPPVVNEGAPRSRDREVTMGLQLPSQVQTGHMHGFSTSNPMINRGQRFVAGADTEPVAIMAAEPVLSPSSHEGTPIISRGATNYQAEGLASVPKVTSKQRRMPRKSSCPVKHQSKSFSKRRHFSSGGLADPRYAPHSAFYGPIPHHSGYGQPFLFYQTREASITSDVTSGDSIISVKRVDAVYRRSKSPCCQQLPTCENQDMPLLLTAGNPDRSRKHKSQSRRKGHKKSSRHQSQGDGHQRSKSCEALIPSMHLDESSAVPADAVTSSNAISRRSKRHTKSSKRRHDRIPATPWGFPHGSMMGPLCPPMMPPISHQHPAFLHPPMMPFFPYQGYQQYPYAQPCHCPSCQHGCGGDSPMAIAPRYDEHHGRHCSQSSDSTTDDSEVLSDEPETDTAGLHSNKHTRSKSRASRGKSTDDVPTSSNEHSAAATEIAECGSPPQPDLDCHDKQGDQQTAEIGDTDVCGEASADTSEVPLPESQESAANTELSAMPDKDLPASAQHLHEQLCGHDDPLLASTDASREVGGQHQQEPLKNEKATDEAEKSPDPNAESINSVTQQLYELPGTRTDVFEVFEEREGDLEPESDIAVEDDTQEAAHVHSDKDGEEQTDDRSKCNLDEEVVPETKEMLPPCETRLPQPLRQMAYALKYFPKTPSDFQAIASVLGIDCLETTSCLYSSLLSDRLLKNKGQDMTQHEDEFHGSWDKMAKFWLPGRSLDQFEEIPFPGQAVVEEFDYIEAVTDASITSKRPVTVTSDQSRTVMRQGDLIVDTRDTSRYFYITAYTRGSGGKLIKSDVIVDKETRAMRVDSNVKTRHYAN